MSPDGVRVERSAGGLATGMREPHERSKGLWFGWPGPLEIDSAEIRAGLAPRFAELGIVPVYLSDAEIRRFYQGFANDVLWPLFHYLTGQVSLRVEGFEPIMPQYEGQINEDGLIQLIEYLKTLGAKKE